MADLRIGTAGWAMPPAATRDPLLRARTALERYARQFDAAEINSSFHRHHRRSTYERWAASVRPDFRFAVKLPKVITHTAKLHRTAETAATFSRFLDETAGLGDTRGPLLVQLPPSLAFEPALAQATLQELCVAWDRAVVCEPRHPSWFDEEPDALLEALRIARVGADPARVPPAAEPGGWTGIAYLRLHGSPRMYHSSYDAPFLDELASRIEALRAGPAREVWCMFDNTASGAALTNVRELRDRLG